MVPPRDGIREVEASLNPFLKHLQSRLSLSACAVFGSRARCDHWVDSDLDLVVVSPDFEGMPRRERIGMLLESWEGPPALEPLGYTPRELMAAGSPILWSALAEGKPVVDDGTWKAALAVLEAMLASGRLRRSDTGGWIQVA